MNKVLKITIAVVLCLIVILAVVLLITQCSNNNAPQETTPPVESTQPTTPPEDPACTEHVDANTDYVCDNCGAALQQPTCTEHVDANTDYACDNCGAALQQPVEEFIETNDKVYVIATNSLYLHKVVGDTANKSVTTDCELERIGYYTSGANEGYSKVIYEGEEYFAGTRLLTTQKPVIVVEGEPETVYVTKNDIKVYSKPSMILDGHYSDEVDTLNKEDLVTRLGVATEPYIDAEGNEIFFAKITYVDYKGDTVTWYVDNAVLTTEAPADPDAGIEFVEDIKTLEVISTYLNLRSSALWIKDDDAFNKSQIAGSVEKGTLLEAIESGKDADGDTWYKVMYEGKMYYIVGTANSVDYVKVVEPTVE